MSSTSTSRCETPRRRSRSSSFSSSQGSLKHDARVQVFVRARPLEEPFSSDITDSSRSLEFPSEREIKLIDTKQETTYRFDHVFSPETTNKEVCDVICTPLIDTVLNGYNGSFMVYGQTGTGKTFTVQSEDGLIPKTMSQLFAKICEDKENDYSVFLSYLQIYHERIYDLLDSTKETDLHLREHPDEGVIVEGLSECEITTTKDAEALLEFGRKQLIVAETKLVRVSSRSHSMCILRIQKRKRRTQMEMNQGSLSTEESFLKGRLYLCDLAGSERLKKSGVTGDRLKEAKYINSSLLELGNVIHALSVARSHHIPFRNSTLTRILKESLGGNSRASLMICVSSSVRHLSETKCSLNFGQRALRVTKSSSPNIECAEGKCEGEQEAATHFAHPYIVTKPRYSSSTLYPKIDYKALSEYLSKKLKELETAYQNEKQSYKRMQDELKISRKGHSKIPILSTRNRTPTPRDEENRFMRDICMEKDDVFKEESLFKAELREEEKEDVEEMKMNVTSVNVKKRKLKTLDYDEIDSGIAKGENKQLKDKKNMDLNEIENLMRGKEKSFTSMSCQTDENANYVNTATDSTMGLEKMEMKVDKKYLTSDELKMTQSSCCQTDDVQVWINEEIDLKDVKEMLDGGKNEQQLSESKGRITLWPENNEINQNNNTNVDNKKEENDKNEEMINKDELTKAGVLQKGDESEISTQSKINENGNYNRRDYETERNSDTNEMMKTLATEETISLVANSNLMVNETRMNDEEADGKMDFLCEDDEKQSKEKKVETLICDEIEEKSFEQINMLRETSKDLNKEIVDINANLMEKLQESELQKNVLVCEKSNELESEVNQTEGVLDMKMKEKEEEKLRKEEMFFEKAQTHYEEEEIHYEEKKMHSGKIEKHFRREEEKDHDKDLALSSNFKNIEEETTSKRTNEVIDEDSGFTSFETTEKRTQKKEDHDAKEEKKYLEDNSSTSDDVDNERLENAKENTNEDILINVSTDGMNPISKRNEMLERSDSKETKDRRVTGEVADEIRKEVMKDKDGGFEIDVMHVEKTVEKQVRDQGTFIDGSSKGIEKELNINNEKIMKKVEDENNDVNGFNESNEISEDANEDQNKPTEIKSLSNKEKELVVEDDIKSQDENQSFRIVKQIDHSYTREEARKATSSEKEASKNSSSREEDQALKTRNPGYDVINQKEVKIRRIVKADEKEDETNENEKGTTMFDITQDLTVIAMEDEEESESSDVQKVKDKEDDKDHHKISEDQLKTGEQAFVESNEEEGNMKGKKEEKEESIKEMKRGDEDITCLAEEHLYFSDDGMADTEIPTKRRNEEDIEKLKERDFMHDRKEVGRKKKDEKKNGYEMIDCLISQSQTEGEKVKEAVIVRNKEGKEKEKRISIGEARIISPKHQKQVHFEKIEDKEREKKVMDIEITNKDDSSATNFLSPSLNLSLEIGRNSLFDSSLDEGSCSPSATSVDSEFTMALKEKEKLQKALTTVKNQYEDLLLEFDKIIETNTNENNEENIQISKESYNVALKCKEELEMEIRKAREQLAMVQAANESQSEDSTWQSSDYEFSEGSESFSFDINDDTSDTPRGTSTPLPYGANTNAPSNSVHYTSNSVQTDDENANKIDVVNRKKPLLQERGTNTSPESEAGSILRNARDENLAKEDLATMKKSDLQRLPATLPRRKGQKRRPKTLQFDELNQGDAKWVSRRSLVDKDQAKKNEKLTLQAIENAELKKELLLTKLEKIRLEAMLSCVMMRVSPTEVEEGFRKLSVNSITSSSSTLRSTTSLTNIPQNDPTSPFQAQSPFRRLTARRVTSSLAGEEHRSSQHRVRFDESRKTPSSTSPRSSSLFGHLSLLTQSSLSPSSLDFEISSYISSDISTPVPHERVSPCGQDGDDKFQSPSSNKSKQEDADTKERDVNVAYRGKSKMRLAACLPFRKKKKNIKERSEEHKDDSYGANC